LQSSNLIGWLAGWHHQLQQQQQQQQDEQSQAQHKVPIV
jgi:hypothetical protein